MSSGHAAKDEVLDLLGFGDYVEPDAQPISGEALAGEALAGEAPRQNEVPTVPPPPVAVYPPPESVPPPPLVPAPPTPSTRAVAAAGEATEPAPPAPSASGIHVKGEPPRRLSSGTMRAIEARNLARVDEVVANLKKDWRSE